MATKTFSGRADADKLAYADALAEKSFGMSFGQYCSSVLLENIHTRHAFPQLQEEDSLQDRRQKALSRLREMSIRLEGSELADMTDEEMKQIIASRYA